MQVLLNQNKIRNKPTSKGNYYFIIEIKYMTVLDETESKCNNTKDDALIIDPSYNTLQIPLTEKNTEKAWR